MALEDRQRPKGLAKLLPLLCRLGHAEHYRALRAHTGRPRAHQAPTCRYRRHCRNQRPPAPTSALAAAPAAAPKRDARDAQPAGSDSARARLQAGARGACPCSRGADGARPTTPPSLPPLAAGAAPSAACCTSGRAQLRRTDAHHTARVRHSTRGRAHKATPRARERGSAPAHARRRTGRDLERRDGRRAVHAHAGPAARRKAPVACYWRRVDRREDRSAHKARARASQKRASRESGGSGCVRRGGQTSRGERTQRMTIPGCSLS